MQKILYRAKDLDDKTKYGYIEAYSNDYALSKLKDAGLKYVELFSDAVFSLEDNTLDGLSDKELEKAAKIAIEDIEKDNGFIKYAINSLKSSAVPIAIGLGITYYGYTNLNPWVMAAGVIFGSFVPFMKLWNYKVISNFDKLYYTYSHGNWDEFLTVSDRLKSLASKRSFILSGNVNKEIIVATDTLKATYSAKKGYVNSALLLLDKHQEYIEESQPAMYSSKVGQIYLAADDYENYIYYTKVANQTQDNDISRLDLALAEARFGNIEDANELINVINVSQLPVFLHFGVELVKGLIYQKEMKISESIDMFYEAEKKSSKFKHNLALLVPIAITRGYLAKSLAMDGKEEDAMCYLDKETIHILKIHADKILLEDLRKYFKDLF